MSTSDPELRIVYAPHHTFRLISNIYDVVLGCLAYYIYFKKVQKIKVTNYNAWLIATKNAYYDLCVLHWCMLFGNQKNEPTHFLHLANEKFNLSDLISSLMNNDLSKTSLKDYILMQSKIGLSDFFKFRKNTIKYRNKNLIHREHDPKVVHDKCMHSPKTESIIRTTFSLYKLIIKLCESLPITSSNQNNYRFVYRIFKSRHQLSSYFLKSFTLKQSYFK